MTKNESKQRDDSDVGAREDATLKRILATPPDHKTKPKPDASPKKRGRPPKTKVNLVSGDPTIDALRRALDRHARSLDPGEHSVDALAHIVVGCLPHDIFSAVFLPANGTGCPRLAIAFKPEFRLYAAFAAEYWLSLVHKSALSPRKVNPSPSDDIAF
jgi:hypothetical protein